jgi:hypothetical protein
MMIQDIRVIVQNRALAKRRIFFPSKLIHPERFEREPLLIILVFDDTDKPSSTTFLHQFERKMDFQSLTEKEKVVSTDVLLNHILPHVVILEVYSTTAEDHTQHLEIVTICKEGYEDLLAGKLRDTIVFRQTQRPGEIDTFQYYPNGLPSYIFRIILTDFKLVELDRVKEIIHSHCQRI